MNSTRFAAHTDAFVTLTANYLGLTWLRYRFPEFSIKLLATQIVSILLMLVLLANSTFAAPATLSVLSVRLNEVGQDIRYAYLNSSLLTKLSEISLTDNPVFAAIFRNKQLSIQNIAILPGDTTIMQGEKINFTAVGLRNGQPVNGIKFTWSITDLGRNRPARQLNDGTFDAHKHGTYTVVAAAQGIQSQVTITVNPNEGYYLQKNLQKVDQVRTNQERTQIQSLKEAGVLTTREISSKANYNIEEEKQRGIIEKQKENQVRIRQNEVRRRNPNRGFTRKPDTVSQVPGEELEGIDRAGAEGMADESEVIKKAAKEEAESVPYRPIEEDGWGPSDWYTADDPVNEIGDPPSAAPDGGASNGNHQISAPVLSLAGRGIDVNLDLVYNSRLWSKSGSVMKYDADKGYPAPGWSLGFGKMIYMGGNGGCMIVSADGTRRSYAGTASIYSSGSYYSNSYTGHTTDGSFIDYTCYYSSSTYGTYLSGSATLPNGTVITFGSPTTLYEEIYPTEIADAQGNYITITYVANHGPAISTITDTLNRTFTFNYDTSNRLISVTGLGYNGSPRTFVQLHYTQMNLNYAFGGGLTTDTATNSPYLIDSIFYPVKKTGYWFGDTNPPTTIPSYSSYGMIAKVIEQRGMESTGTSNSQGTVTPGVITNQVVYNYDLTPNPNLTDSPGYTTKTETWANMDTDAAVTDYSVTTNSTTEVITVSLPHTPNTPPVTKIKETSYNDPANPQNGIYFQGETLAASNNAVLAKTKTFFQVGDYGTQRPYRVESTDELNQTKARTFDYGTSYNQLTSEKEYDYTNTFYRETKTTYENNAAYLNRHIFNLVKSTETYDANNVRQSLTEYQYDNNAVVTGPPSTPTLIAATGVVMHKSSYDPFTTETITIPGYCAAWEYNYYPDCHEGIEWVWINGEFQVYCPNERYCSNYIPEETVSVYDPNTVFRGNLTKIRVYENAQTASNYIDYYNTFDITGNERTVTTNCCQQMSFDYSTATQFSKPDYHKKGSATDPNQRITESATYDFNTGATKTATDFNGRTTTATYDSITRPIQTTLPTGGKTTTEYYDASLNIIQTAMEANNNIASRSSVFINGRGQVISSQQLAGSIWNIVATKYDVMGRTWQTSLPYPSGGSPTQWTTATYDQLSRPTIVTAPDGSTVKTFYNETSGNQLVRPSSAIQGAPGNTVRKQDAWGRERWARTDDFGRLVEVVEPAPDGNGSVFDSGNLRTTYIYDVSNQLVQISQGEQVRLFKYDSLGRMTHQRLAEQSSGANYTGSINDAGQYVGAGNGLWTDAFTYDQRSNLIKRVDARGVITNLNYNVGGAPDPLNRLQSVSFNTSTADTSKPILDAATVTLGYMPDGDKTRIETVTTANPGNTVTETNSYNAEGLISHYTIALSSRSSYPMVSSYLYDTLNRVTEIKYPKQYGMTGDPRKIVNPSYDNAGRLTQLNVNGATQLSDLVYNPLSQVTNLKTGAATGNADIEEYTYDPSTALLTSQKVKKANTNQELLYLSYNYNRGNSKGSLNGKTSNLTNIVNNLDRNKDRVYEYDALGRLKTAKGGLAAGATGVTSNWTQNYSYDRYGNRTEVSFSGVTANNQAIPTDGLPSLSYANQTNRILTSGYEYDLAGNQTRGQAPDGSWQRYEYDAAGRLGKIKTDAGADLETYTYGASSERLIKQTSTQRTYYAWGGATPLIEYVENPLSSNTPVYSKSYVYAGARLLSTAVNNSGTEMVEFHHPDQLGTKLITNPAANTSSEQNILPFGTVIGAETTANTNQKFTSYDRSTTTGLDYAVNRTYSSGQSRFIQVDRLGMGAASMGDPQLNNLYSYVRNNPINLIDPSGLDICFGYHVYLLHSEDGGESWSVQYLGFLSLWCESDRPIDDGNGGGGGGGAGGGDGGSSDDRSPLDRLKDAIDSCSRRFFGVTLTNFEPTSAGGSGRAEFEEFTNPMIGHTIYNDASSFAESDLDLDYGFTPALFNSDGTVIPGYYKVEGGFASGTQFSAYTNETFTARDNSRPTEFGISGYVWTQVHEIGNSLSILRDHFIGNGDNPRGDPDSGYQFEQCVKGEMSASEKPKS